MQIIKGFIECEPTEFNGQVYGGAGNILFAETIDELIDLMQNAKIIPLKIGEKLVFEAIEMSCEEFATIPDYNG